MFSLLLLFLVRQFMLQNGLPESQHRNWHVSIWVAGATGEENTNSFSDAQSEVLGLEKRQVNERPELDIVRERSVMINPDFTRRPLPEVVLGDLA